jgi:hypothetical protein
MTIKKTAAQFVLDHLDEIEHKIAMGYYQTAILADLADAGNEMTLATFRKSLARARNKKTSQSERSATSTINRQDFSGSRMTPSELIQLEKGTHHHVKEI